MQQEFFNLQGWVNIWFVSISSRSQTMLEGVYGYILACNRSLTGPSEVSLGLQCFIADLNTNTVCECDALECPEELADLSRPSKLLFGIASFSKSLSVMV